MRGAVELLTQLIKVLEKNIIVLVRFLKAVLT